MDNDPRDKYLYELMVITGARSRCGTTARVFFILSGENYDAGPRLLQDDQRKVLQRGATDAFILAVPRSLGTLTHLR